MLVWQKGVKSIWQGWNLTPVLGSQPGQFPWILRERVQISASGHTDADQLGTDFFRLCWRSDPILSVPNETEAATGLNSLSGQLTKVIKNIWQLKKNPSQKQKQKSEWLFYDVQAC